MKAITLWEPYATLVAIGAKPHETRSWATNYRGPIAIHAAKKDVHKIMRELPHDVLKAIYDSLYKGFDIKSGALRRLEAAQGHIVATAILVECWKVIEHTPTAIILRQSNGIGEDKVPIDASYLMFGDYRVGRYIWGLADICKLPEPVQAKGMQGLWNWTGTPLPHICPVGARVYQVEQGGENQCQPRKSIVPQSITRANSPVS